jgi:hypothetical protein
MKKTFIAIISAFLTLIVGCKEPTVESMTVTATAVGRAAALVVNETGIDAKTRETIVDVLGTVAKVTPAPGQSFEDAWTPVVNETVDKMVADGKISDTQGVLVKSAFSVIVKGLDYIFTVRYPKAKEYEDLVTAAITGFSNGFLEVFKVEPTKTVSSATIDFDKEAFEYLKKR